MADYARFLFDAFSAPGDAIRDNRIEKTRNAQDDRNYARALGLDDWRKQTDERDYTRLVGRDAVTDNQWERGFNLQERTANRLEAAASRPNIETFYTPDGRETKGYYDPSAPGGFVPVGGSKANTASIPNAYQPRPEGGGLTFIPGGPADPAVVARLAGVRGEARPSRPLPNATVKDLGEFGSAVEDMRRLTEGFNDGYSGYKTSWAGDITNSMGRNLGMGFGDQAAWWQDYQSRKNVVRNKLFGSALTASEKPEFEAADINPGMTPEAIKTNLARQQMIARRAARKLATAYAKQGYSQEGIEAALGMSLQDIEGGSGGYGGGQQQPNYQTQDIEAELRRRGLK